MLKSGQKTYLTGCISVRRVQASAHMMANKYLSQSLQEFAVMQMQELVQIQSIPVLFGRACNCVQSLQYIYMKMYNWFVFQQ